MKSPVERVTGMVCILCASLLAGKSAAQPGTTEALHESAQRGFPVMFNLQGTKLADGEFIQWLENGLLHVTIDYDFGNGRRVEEKTSMRQIPRLVQEEWSWNESENGQTLRRFEVDFRSAKATAEKRSGNDVKHWSENIKVEPGRTFAGFAFVLAIKSVREQLVQGQKVELEAVGFTPKPHVVTVEISYNGRNEMHMADRIVQGDIFTIHPKIPTIAKAFVTANDTHIWLTSPPAVGFLRWEGPLVESNDPFVRVDLLRGEHSGPAEPALTH